MTTAGHSANADNPTLGIILIVTGMFAISVNDMLIKLLAGAYPLHQIVFARSAIGLLICLVIVALDGGLAILKTPRPLLHMLRGLLIVIANTAFFLGFVIMPLADVTALFFVAPLLITLLSMPLLGERVGARRIGAVVVGFIGVVIMIQPGSGCCRAATPAP